MIKTLLNALFRRPDTEPLTILTQARAEQTALTNQLERDQSLQRVLKRVAQNLK